MKKIISVFLAVITAFSVLTVAFALSGELKLVSDDGNAAIIIPESAKSTESYAASALQKYIKEMTGKTLEIYPETVKLGGKKIYVGDTAYTGFDFDGVKDGGYFITSDSDCVKICGKGNAGTVYAAYAFLEEFCGLHIYTKDIHTINSAKSFSVPDNINISYQPYFSARRLDTASAYNTEYKVANGINNNGYIPENMGGDIPYLGNFCHSLTTTLCAASKYFDEHPEYFALHGGERTPDQLCLTNEDTVKIVTADVLELLKNQADPNADLQIVSVTQNDNQSFCECEKCAALDKANGSHSGTMITFANRIAEAVKNAGYDNIAIDTFAYQYTRQAPTNVVPADNVIVRLCSIECCFGHALEDENCKQNAEFIKDLDAWSKICKRIYIWDYVNNYSETLCPFANFQVLQKNVQTFYEHNAIGVYEEGNYYMDRCEGEFAELRTYMLSQFLKDPYCDYDEVMNGYLEAYYGAGWKNIREYIDIISAHSVTKFKHLEIRQQPRAALPGITPKEITRCDELWENAKNAAKDEAELKRIERSELSWLYWKCSNFKKEFSIFHNPYTYMHNREMLYNKLIDFGFTIIGEGDIKVLNNIPSQYLLMPCDFWETKHDKPFWHAITPFVLWFYGVVTEIFGK